MLFGIFLKNIMKFALLALGRIRDKYRKICIPKVRGNLLVFNGFPPVISDTMALQQRAADNSGSGPGPDFSLKVIPLQGQITIHELTAMLPSEFRRAGYRESTVWRNYMPDLHTIEKYYEKRRTSFSILLSQTNLCARPLLKHLSSRRRIRR